ncbi:MAG: acetate/propionate family kinase [Christensenellales bacterium]|jgi:acetate kinase
MKVLIVNAGSSSLKYQVIDMSDEQLLCKGLVECIGMEGSNLVHKTNGKELKITRQIADHTDALRVVLSALTDKEYGVVKDIKEIFAVGHRVVHSGEDFSESVIITPEVLALCKQNAYLAPLHMPANIACIESSMQVMKDVPMVAVFDTAFHSTLPQKAFMYAIDYDDYKKYKARKYGFHGTSHKYVSEIAAKKLGKPHTKIITCHLGNGSSISAVVDGKCVDTSMGLTPLSGVIMGSRCGDVDPALVSFLSELKGVSAEQITQYLNKKCGFLGIVGVSDFRRITELAQKGFERARLAIDMFQYSIKKYIGMFSAVMNGLDAIVFTGGIGENAANAREGIIRDLDYLGIDFDFEKNSSARGEFLELTKPESKVKVYVIATNEELVIAREAKALLSG